MSDEKDIDRTTTAVTEEDASLAKAGELLENRSGSGTRMSPNDRYTIVDEAGRGGIGRVMRAKDHNLDREIAIKELLHPGATAEARFLREAKITARLQHPGIVPIYETGRWPNGDPYYAMKMVAGKSLKQLINEAETLEDRLALIPNVLNVADTIAYAHSQGIIHRDLKPSNVIVGDFGETIVIDWGLARDVDDDHEPDANDNTEATDSTVSPYRIAPDPKLTATGAVIGTPSYMAPEQATGAPITKAADIYALGGILFHVVFQRPPHQGEDSAEIVANLIDGKSPEFDSSTSISKDLSSVIAKAVAPQTTNRYQSITALSEDLRRYLAGQRVSAHAYTISERFRLFRSRNRVLVFTSAIASLVMFLLAATSIWRIVDERNQAKKARYRAEIAKEETSSALRTLQSERDKLLLERVTNLLTSDPTAAIQRLLRYEGKETAKAQAYAEKAIASGVAFAEIRSGARQIFDLSYLENNTVATVGNNGVLEVVEVDTERTSVIAKNVSSVALSPARERLAFAQGLEVSLVNTDNLKIKKLGSHSSRVTAVAATRKWSASIDTSGTINIWGAERSSCDPHLGGGSALVASGSENFIISLGSGVVQLCELDGDSRKLGEAATVASLALSKDSRFVIWSGPTGKVVLHDLQTRVTSQISSDSSLASRFAFSSDSRYVAFATANSQVCIVNLETMEIIRRTTVEEHAYAVTFSKKGSLLSFGDSSGIVIFDVETKKESFLPGHNRPWALSFSSDSSTLFSGGLLGTTRGWRAKTSYQRLARSPAFVVALAVGQSSGDLVASTSPGRVALVSGNTSSTIGQTAGNIWKVHFAENDTVVFGANSKGVVRWDLRRENQSQFYLATGRLLAFAANKSGTRIAAGLQSGIVRLWETRPANLLRELVLGSPVADLRFFGDSIYVGETGGNVLRYNFEHDQKRLLLDGQEGLKQFLVLAPDRIVTVSHLGSERVVVMHDIANGLKVLLARHSVVAPTVAKGLFLAQNEHSGFASTGLDGQLFVFDGKGKMLTMRTELGPSAGVAYSPSGRWLAHASSSGTIRILNTSTKTWRFLGVPEQIQAISFRGEERIVIGGSAGSLFELQIEDSVPSPKEGTRHLRLWIKGQLSP